jgi:hypothetical protein
MCIGEESLGVSSGPFHQMDWVPGVLLSSLIVLLHHLGHCQRVFPMPQAIGAQPVPRRLPLHLGWVR